MHRFKKADGNRASLAKRLKVGLGRVFFIGLLVGSIIFSMEAIQQYFQARTSFEISHQLLSPNDLPVLIVCYGTSLNCWDNLTHEIKYTAMVNDARKTFTFNSSVIAYPDVISVERVCNFFTVTTACDKITLGKNFLESLKADAADIKEVTFSLDINANDKLTEVHIYMASVPNSYIMEIPGSAINKDGLVTGVTLARKERKLMPIYTQDFSYLPNKCTKNSIYDRLNDRVKDIASSARLSLTYEEDGKTKNCPSLTPCLTKSRNSLADCKNLNMLICLKNIMDMAMRDLEKQSNDTSKSCEIKEYLPANEAYLIGRKSDQPDFTFDCALQSPKSLHQLTDKILKTVKKEYYIINEIGLIGMVGGTLGLFIGISFLNMTTWVIDLIFKTRGLF